MSSLENKAITALRKIKDYCLEEVFAHISVTHIIVMCDEVLKEHDARKKRLGEKENLSKDSK